MAQSKEFEGEKVDNKELVKMSTETIGGSPSQGSLWAQAELNRRLIVSIENFDKATTKYTKILLVINVILLIVALFQLIAAIAPKPENWKEELGVFSIIFLGILFTEYLTIKWIKNDE